MLSLSVPSAFFLGLLSLFAPSAFAAPLTEAALQELVSKKVVELADYYQRLGRLAKSDSVLARIGFKPDSEVALAGGLCRELAWSIAFDTHRNPTRLNEVHSIDRDLDMLYLGPADGDDEAYVLRVMKDVMQETLADHGAQVMRIDTHSLREKEEESLLGQQGYDTVSQALLTPTAVLDLALLLKFQTANEATAALLKPSIVYHLPHGALEAPAPFLHQLTQVLRILKIAAEFPKAPLTDETRKNIRTVLEAFGKRQAELEKFMKAAGDRGDNYFRNRIGDVYAALLRFQGGGALYKEFDAEFGVSKFAPLRALVTNAAVTRRTVTALATGTPTPADLDRVLRPGDRYPMGNGFSFDPEQRQILFAESGATTRVALALRATGPNAAEGKAFSGAQGPVEPELLPIERWEILRVRRFTGTLWAVIAKNRRSDYHVAGILDTAKGQSAQILFINNRSFSADARMGNHVGKRGPMIGMLDVTANRTGLVGFGANRAFSQLTLESGSFKVEPYPVQVPMRSRVAAFEIEDSTVYFLAADGQLFSLTDTGAAELLLENVLGIAKGEQGLLAYVQEMPAKTPALYVFERGARGYRRLPLPPLPTDAAAAAGEMPLALAGNDGAAVLRRDYGNPSALVTESAALAYLRRPEAELVEAMKALVPRLPAGKDIAMMFAQVTASDQAPIMLTNDDRPATKRVGILAKFREAVLAASTGPDTRVMLGELFLLRSVLEMRRGRTAVFGSWPNTFLLPQLFEYAGEFASPATLPILAELATPETIDELLFREPTTDGSKNGALEPRFIFFVKQAAATHFGGASCMAALGTPP